MMIDVKDVTVCYGDLTILDRVSFSVQEGQWVMLIGPNGAGKSTLVHAIAQGVPYTGAVLYKGHDIAKMKPAYMAKEIGVLTQSHHVAYSFAVEEIVKLGRYSYSPGIFNTTTDEDARQVQNALEITGMLPFKEQSVLTLSGGELQRVFLAQVFAQDPNLLILDEPTNHLDLVYQKHIVELIGKWLQQPGRAVLSVVHDLGLARAYGTHGVLLNKGKVVSSGLLHDVITRDHLRHVYNMDVYDWMRGMLSRWEPDPTSTPIPTHT
ncbi:MAG: ABC transporter ATP-binding protein [Peptococcaceae bacterium]|nr:ABC transporter ATP-binding protein [Peptococcaceae bacterium]